MAIFWQFSAVCSDLARYQFPALALPISRAFVTNFPRFLV